MIPHTWKSDPWSTWIRRAGLISVVMFIWALSFFLFSRPVTDKRLDVGTIAALLFGASSIALFLLSMIVAFLALVGWRDIQERLKYVDDMDKKIKVKIDKEMPGRMSSLVGFFIGELSIDRDSLQVKDENAMKDAIQYCQKGYALMKEVGGPGQFMALNNLVFYSSLIGDNSTGEFLLHQGRILRKEALEHNSIDLLLTSCRTILGFSRDENEKSEARHLLESIAAGSTTSEKQRREALAHLGLPS
jgi:hypothetical protein